MGHVGDARDPNHNIRCLLIPRSPSDGGSGKDEFSYVVKDASGKTDSAKVHVRVKPAH